MTTWSAGTAVFFAKKAKKGQVILQTSYKKWIHFKMSLASPQPDPTLARVRAGGPVAI